MENSVRFFSLLEPYGDNSYFQLNNETANDLSLDFIVQHLSDDKEEQNRLKAILLKVPSDRRILEYRQAVYNDLKTFPEICSKLLEIFNEMKFYSMDSRSSINDKSTIWEFISFLRSLQNYVKSVSSIQELLKDKEFKSEGMKNLAGHIKQIYEDSGFSELSKDLEGIGEEIDGIHSMTLGVNFDHNFYPDEVGIISFNSYYFTEKGFLEKFLSFHKKNTENDSKLTPFTMLTHPKKGLAAESPLMNNLTGIVERMLPDVTRKMSKLLKKYTDISGTALAECGNEIMFYVRFIELEKRLSEINMPCSMPVISEKETLLEDFYNIKLAMCAIEKKIENDVVCNNISFADAKNILILTGPNRGGKTILTQGIGLAFLLFQHGMFVPCRKNKINLCDGIYTHFPADENKTVSLGRLGEESERFSQICKAATSSSLLLLNESFSTTSHTESLYIAEDAVKYMTCLGARVCFNTHMHELAENAENLRCEQSVCDAVSVVMGKGKSAFKISYEKPDGKSYAHNIACKYGITFEQLIENNTASHKENASET